MAEEQRNRMARWAKRIIALLLTIIMVVEQVPWNINIPIWAKADPFFDPPGLTARIQMEPDAGGVQIEQGVISMSKKMTAKGYVHINEESGSSNNRYFDVNVHIDTPYIFRMEDGKTVISSMAGVGADGRPVSPDTFALEMGWELIGGVEVAFPSMQGWTMWKPERGDEMLEKLLEEELEEELEIKAPVNGGQNG